MTEFVIKPDGGFVKREVAETPIDIQPEIEKAFQSNTRIRLNPLMDLEEMGEPFYGLVAVSKKSNDDMTWWSVGVRKLNLQTTFTLKDGVMWPTFDNEGQFIEIPWTPPKDMRLTIGLSVSSDFQVTKIYLVAYDDAGHTWRLPLSNLYDHLELCHGQNPQYFLTSFDAVMTALKRFRASRWNSDLRGDFQRKNAHHMFRFKPLNTGFEQLPPIDEWHKFCQKAANVTVTENLSPI